MTVKKLQITDKVIVDRQDFQQLFTVLEQQEYELVGPTIVDGAIAYDNISLRFLTCPLVGQMNKMEVLIVSNQGRIRLCLVTVLDLIPGKNTYFLPACNCGKQHVKEKK